MGCEPYLDHVQIAAPPGAEPRARAFYGDLLGLAEVAKPVPLKARGGVWFALGGGVTGAQLHVGIEPEFRPALKAHPALRFDPQELQALAERLTAAGRAVRWTDELPALRRFYTDDPFGNRLELLAVPDGSSVRPAPSGQAALGRSGAISSPEPR
jgi:catechol 2,3-dioxygenase-like lactoylglutathione lyase family enzyme